MKKRILSLAMCLCLAATLFPTTALAAVQEKQEGPQIAISNGEGFNYRVGRHQYNNETVTEVDLEISLTNDSSDLAFAADLDNWFVNHENFIVKYNNAVLTSDKYSMTPVSRSVEDTSPVTTVFLRLNDVTASGTVTVQAKAAAFTGEVTADSNTVTQTITLPKMPTEVSFGPLDKETNIPTSIQWKLTSGGDMTGCDIVLVSVQLEPGNGNGSQYMQASIPVADSNGIYSVPISATANSDVETLYKWFQKSGNLRNGKYRIEISYGKSLGGGWSTYLWTTQTAELSGTGIDGDALVYNVDRSVPAGSELHLSISASNCTFNQNAVQNPSNWEIELNGTPITPSRIWAASEDDDHVSIYLRIPPNTTVGDIPITIKPKAAIFNGTVAESRINEFDGKTSVTAFAPAIVVSGSGDNAPNIKSGQTYAEILIHPRDTLFDVNKAKQTDNWVISGESGLTLSAVENVDEHNAMLVFTGKAIGNKTLTIAAKPAAFGVDNGSNTEAVTVPVSAEAFTPAIRGNMFNEIGDTQGSIFIECSNAVFADAVTNLSNWVIDVGTTGITVTEIGRATNADGQPERNVVWIDFTAAGGAKGGDVKVKAKAPAFGLTGEGTSNEVTLTINKVAKPTEITYIRNAQGNPIGLTWKMTKSDDAIYPNIIRVQQWKINSDGSSTTSGSYSEPIAAERLEITPNPPEANGVYTYRYTLDSTRWKPNDLAAGTYLFGIVYQGDDEDERERTARGPEWTISSGGSSGGGSSRPSSGGSSSSGTTTSKPTTNPDGSTTTKTEDKTTGTVTETTKAPDGSQKVVATQKDGTVTTTATDKDGNKTETVAKTDGSRVTKVEQKDGTTASVTTDTSGKTQAEVKVPAAVVTAAQQSGETLALPIPAVQARTVRADAPAVTVSTGSSTPVKVAIPTENANPGTVAVLVNANGTEEIIKTSVATADGVAVSLPDGATVKIVDNSKTFADVPAENWAADAVRFSSARELFSGTGENSFTPNAPMTRAMMVTVLARFDGADTNGGDTWYEKGVDWAVEKGISDGSAPESSVTREQLAVMLWRYAGSPAPAGTLEGFSDAGSVSDYAQEAMRWAVENGIVNGFGDGQLGPQGQATRAQVAQMLKNFIEKA